MLRCFLMRDVYSQYASLYVTREVLPVLRGAAA